MPDLFPNAPFSVKPEPGRTEPRLWVKRFCIWSEPGVTVREIELREGLNIIWSPDSRDGSAPIGHGAGKTTFCRLLRYCLGEETFGSRDQRSRIHAAFPKGQVGAEVILDGKQWAILRSINGRTRDIALQGITLEQAQEADTPTTMETDSLRLDVYNGFLLSSLWDAAFDAGVITFSSEGLPIASTALSANAFRALRLDESPVLRGITHAHNLMLRRHRAKHHFTA